MSQCGCGSQVRLETGFGSTRPETKLARPGCSRDHVVCRFYQRALPSRDFPAEAARANCDTNGRLRSYRYRCRERPDGVMSVCAFHSSNRAHTAQTQYGCRIECSPETTVVCLAIVCSARCMEFVNPPARVGPCASTCISFCLTG